MVSSWMLEEVAEAQLVGVKKELENPLHFEVYSKFLYAMLCITEKNLLDIGCGTGSYGVLCQRYYPTIKYMGTDASSYMIERARKLCPSGEFAVRDLKDNSLDYDIVLASAVLEYAGAFDGLGFLLDRFKKYLVLHRTRVCEEPSHYIEETTYCGNSEKFFIWNLDELRRFIEKRARIEKEYLWGDNQSTFVIKK